MSKSNILLSIIKWGLSLAFLTPLIIDNQFIFPYVFPRQAAFQILVEILLGLYVILAIKFPDYRPRSSRLFLAIAVYFGFLVLSSVIGVNPYHSFWSTYERMTGVISLFHYFGFLLIAANVFKSKDDWHRFFIFSVITSFAQGLYSLGQVLGVRAVFYGERIEGTVGNPSFLAGYMLLNALIAGWLILEKKNIWWRVFFGLAAGLDLFIVYQTQTRGAMLALGFVILTLTLFFIFAPKSALNFKRRDLMKKIATGGLALFILLNVWLWLAKDTDFVKSQPTLARVTSISFTEGTTQTRLMAWGASLKGFAENPVFGWGPENYYIVFNKYYNPNMYPVESWFDHAHNAYLDVLVSSGILGIFAYLSIFFFAFRYLFRRRKGGAINYQTLAFFAIILLAYMIQNFFLFDTQVTLLMFFSVLAYILFVSFKGRPDGSLTAPARINFLFAGILLVLVVLSVYFFNVRPGLAGAKGVDAVNALALKSGDPPKLMAENFRQAYNIKTFGLPEVAMRAGDLALQALQAPQLPDNIKKVFVDVAIEGLKKSLEFEPESVRHMLMTSNIYLGSYAFDSQYLQEADKILQRATELSPTRQELYYSLGQLRMYQARNDEVLPLFKKALDLNDKVALSHWNYGIAAIGLGQKSIGEPEIEKAVALGHSYNVRDLRFLINAYATAKDWPGSVGIYKQWIEKNPSDPEAYSGLAAVYVEIGDKKKAKEYALLAVQVDPTFGPAAEQFIKNFGL